MEELSSLTASDYFGGMVESYDSLIRRAVPRYEEMTSRLVEYLPVVAGHILELGCGTGNLSLRLAGRYPDSRFTFVDASPEMIEVTRQRLAGISPGVVERSRFLVDRFEELSLEPESCDLVTSSISLHHVREKDLLYRRLHTWLIDGGRLCFSDQLRGEPEENHALNWDRWLEFCRQQGNCSREEIESLLAHAEAHDHYTPLGEHFALLEHAGFRSLDCVWRNWIWGIVTATA
jgi:trans-aconitate 2-methyltransferase